MIIHLKNNYSSIYNLPIINKINTNIFNIKYNSNCLTCDFCDDYCCSHGVDIDIENVKRILKFKTELENISSTDWFFDNYNIDDEFPGKLFTRIKTKNNKCVFYNFKERGCLIHKFCLENNIDVYYLKPITCSLFPISFNNGELSSMIDESYICANDNISLFDNLKLELKYYFGKEFVNELEAIR
jgi:Fe-S-cluster containining protein